MLHEPRLIANVPVFCIVAIKPLIGNIRSTEFVANGAIKLLMYLHTRLEVGSKTIHTGLNSNDDVFSLLLLNAVNKMIQ